jgi:glycosyltransferase involved in cell wall biosynthesis
MSEHIVGMMWNRNEGDILPFTIASALEHVDTLVLADDGSTDNSWEVMKSFAKAHPDQIEHIQQRPDSEDKGQRQALLNVIRERYRPEDTWVQVIESDIMIFDTDIRQAIKERSNDILLRWQLLNASPPPGENKWDGIDEYPNWSRPIQEIMTHAHRLEMMPYTYRPFKELKYDYSAWRPWPRGFTKIQGGTAPHRKSDYTPLLAHYGYRGPTHFYQKYKNIGRHPRYRSWDITSVESVKETVYFFNNQWGKHAFPMTRYGWMNRKNRSKTEWIEGRGWGPRINERRLT